MKPPADAAQSAPSPTRGAPGSLTASLRRAPPSPLRPPSLLAKRLGITDQDLRETRRASSLTEPDPGAGQTFSDGPADPTSSVSGDAVPSVDTASASLSLAQPKTPSPTPPAFDDEDDDDDALATLLHANTRLRSELDTTTAALADAVSSRFASERALDVASRTHTHYGRMASGRSVNVTREVADDLRLQIELQAEKLRAATSSYEVCSRTLADTRRAFGAETSALREALDGAIHEVSEKKMEMEVLRLACVDKSLEEDEESVRLKKAGILPPMAQQAVVAAKQAEKAALESVDVAIEDAGKARAELEEQKELSSQAATELANAHLREMRDWRNQSDKEIASLRNALRVAETSSNDDRLEFQLYKESSCERDALLQDTLLKMEQTENDLNRCYRALQRKGGVITLGDGDAGKGNGGEGKVNESAKAEAHLEKVSSLEAKVRRLSEEQAMAAGMHGRAVAGLRREHSEAVKIQVAEIASDLEKATAAFRASKKRADAFESALFECNKPAAVAVSAAIDAKESLLGSLGLDDFAGRDFVFEGEISQRASPVRARSPKKETPENEKNGPEKSARRSLALGSKKQLKDVPGEAPLGSISSPLKSARSPARSPERVRMVVTTAGEGTNHTAEADDAADSLFDDSVPPPPLPPLPPDVADAVSKRLSALDRQVSKREKHWQGVLREVHLAHVEQTESAKRACFAAVETKNAQIRKFKAKLNVLIAAAHEDTIKARSSFEV